MDKILLNCIEGLTGEDYTTALLGYLLEYSSNEVLSDIFSIQNIITKSNITNQKKIKNGRFDLFIECENSCIVIENKFYASFTYVNNINQLERYSSWLSSQSYENKTLVCLCIESRRSEVEKIFSSIKNDDVTSKIVCWEQVVDILNNGDDIQKALSIFVTDRYLKRISFNQCEVDTMLDVNTAKAYNKIFKMIERIRDLIKDENIKLKGNIKYEQGAYGFYFLVNKKEYWFGFDSKYWEITGIPFDLQLRSNSKNINERFRFSHDELFGKHLVFTSSEIEEDTKLASLIKNVC